MRLLLSHKVEVIEEEFLQGFNCLLLILHKLSSSLSMRLGKDYDEKVKYSYKPNLMFVLPTSITKCILDSHNI